MFSNLKINRITFGLILAGLWVVSMIAVARYKGVLPQAKLNSDKIYETQKIVDEESVVIDVVEKVSPSVVSIAVENRQTINFFGIPTQGKQESSGIGTGFVVSKDGLIMTNKHVVSGLGEKYTAIIRANDGQERTLEVKEINRDPFNDLAIIKVDATDLVPLDLGDSDNLKVGQMVIAIGNALGRFENTVTTGVVSGLGRGVNPFDPTTGIAERLDDLIQTDAAINPGNSGGPLVNSAGQVIGINTAVASAENIGFALKVNIAKQLIEDFNSSGGKISRPFLGVRYTHISQDVALLNEVPQGELVREVVKASAADNAGIQVGDIITEFDGQKLGDESKLTGIIRSKKVGDVIKLKVYRNKNTLDLTVNLGEAPNE
jgi:S1-C subfamily serine protease